MRTRLFYTGILAMLLSITTAKAQLGSHLGFNVGPTISTFHGSNYAENFRGKGGFSVGLVYQYAINPTFALHTGLLFESKGVSSLTILDPFDIEVRTRSNFNYLTLPVLLRAHLMPAKKLRPYINVGPYFGFLVRQTNVVRTENGDNYDVERSNNTDDFRGFDIGISGGVGIDYLITNDIHLDFEIRDNLGLYNINESNNDNFRLNNNSVNFLIGMIFSIH
jgi:Outer membrane protein beta-barrel domain